MMRWFSRCRSILSLILALCLLIPLSPKSYAVEVDTSAEEEVELYYTGTSLISASIAILSSGKAECWGVVDCYPGYTADAVMRLQWKNSNGAWIDWKSWDADGTVIDFYEVCSIPQGRTYRVRVVADVSDAKGNWVETVSAISGSEYY